MRDMTQSSAASSAAPSHSRVGVDVRAHTPPRGGSAASVVLESKAAEAGADSHTHVAAHETRAFLRLHALVDVLDTHNKWCEATIEELDHVEGAAFVHYLFWTSRWDEWIPLTSHRLQPHGSRTYQVGGELRVGHQIDVWDPHPAQRRYQDAVVIEERTDAVKVHFTRFSSRFDEWIPRNSSRIAPHGHHTRERQPYRPRAQTYWARRKREMVFSSDLDPRLVHYLRALAEQGLRVQPMGGDGNCLFRSVAHQVYGDQELHAVCRAAAAEYMQIEAEWFRNFVVGNSADFNQYILNIRQNGVWGDDPEIQALCELYDRSAVIYAYDPVHGARKLRVFRSERADSRPPIILSYYGGGHYDSIVGAAFYTNLLRTPPGTVEDRAINLARLRNASGVSRQGGASEADAAEAAAVGEALRASREMYDAADSNLDAALLVSLGVAPEAAVQIATSRVAAASASAATGGPDLEQTVMETVLARTAEEDTQAAILENLRKAHEDEQLQAALQASAAAAGVAGTDDDDLETAIAMSISAEVTTVSSQHGPVVMTGTDELYNVAMELSEDEQLALLLSGETLTTRSNIGAQPQAAASQFSSTSAAAAAAAPAPTATSAVATAQASAQPATQPPAAQPPAAQPPAAPASQPDEEMLDEDALLAAAIAASLEAS